MNQRRDLLMLADCSGICKLFFVKTRQAVQTPHRQKKGKITPSILAD
jgi:hypothetical protein